MSDPRTRALSLARAQAPGAVVAATLVKECGLSREEAVALVNDMADALADEELWQQGKMLERAVTMAEGVSDQKGYTALTEWLRQYCGWTSDGVDKRVRKVAAEVTRDKYRSTGLRVAG